MLTGIRRYAPLIGVFVLAASTLLRYFGLGEAAAAVEGAGTLAGAQAPPAAYELAAAVTAAVGAILKLRAVLLDASKSK